MSMPNREEASKPENEAEIAELDSLTADVLQRAEDVFTERERTVHRFRSSIDLVLVVVTAGAALAAGVSEVNGLAVLPVVVSAIVVFALSARTLSRRVEVLLGASPKSPEAALPNGLSLLLEQLALERREALSRLQGSTSRAGKQPWLG